MLTSIKYFARLGTALSLAVIFIASLFGRNLVDRFPFLENSYLLAVAAILGGALVLSFFAKALRRVNISQLIFKLLRLDWVSAALLLLALLFFCAGEMMIELPIERVHLVKYSSLAFFLFFSLALDSKTRTFVYASLISATIGSLEETAQLWIPKRFFDWRDLLLNINASLIGATLAAALYRQAVQLELKPPLMVNN